MLNNSTDFPNPIAEHLEKVNSQKLCPHFFSQTHEKLNRISKLMSSKQLSSNFGSSQVLTPPQISLEDAFPKSKYPFLKRIILKANDNNEKNYDSSPSFSANEKSEKSSHFSLLKSQISQKPEESQKSSRSLKKNRKSFSYCNSNDSPILKEILPLSFQINLEKNKETNIEFKKAPESILMNSSTKHAFLQIDTGLLPKKRASFQVQPTYEDKKIGDFPPKNLQKNLSFSSLKNQNKLSSLKSLHKNIQRKEKHHTLVKNNDDIAKTQTAFYQVISNLYLTKKFISILKNLTSFRKPKWLNEMHFDIMNDLSFDYKNYQKLLKETNITPILKKKNLVRDFCEKTKESLYYISEFLPVFDPTRKFSIFWDSFVMLAISFYFIMIPFYIFISNNTLDQNFNFYIVKTVFLYILGFDILKSFFSSYYHKGLIVKNRKKIMLYYIKTNLFIDLLTLGPLIINPILSHLNLNLSLDFDSWYLEIPKLLFFLRYSRFVEISKKLGELVFVDKNIQSALSLVKLIFRIMILSHIFACMWYMIGNSRFYMSNNWIVNNDLNDSEWWMQYLYAYYFVCVTMNTVGFGDISPSNPLEVLFVIVFMFVACGIFAYSLNSIGIIVSDIWKRQNEFAKDLNIINQFMRDKSINFDLTMRVRKYLEYIWNEEKLEEVEQQVRIINKLSDSLKDELLLEANGPVIREIKLFSLNFSEETLREMISIIKEVRYTPGDIIFTKNELSNSIYILKRGEVELFIDRAHSCNELTVLKKLVPGETFGELSFFTNNERTTSARSTDFTNVFMIKQEDFLRLLRKNNSDFQRFCEIKDNIKIFDNCDDLFLRCFSCKSVSHELKYCPLLHYIPKEDIIIQKYNYSEPQNRIDPKLIRRRKKYNSLRNLDKIEKSAYKLIGEIFPSHETSSSEELEEEEEDEEKIDDGKYKKVEQSENSYDVSILEEEEPSKVQNNFLIETEEKPLKVNSSKKIIKAYEKEIKLIEEDNSNEVKDEEEEEVEKEARIKNIKRRVSRKKVYWKKEGFKKMLSSQISQIPQKELREECLKIIRESIFINRSEHPKKNSIASASGSENYKAKTDNSYDSSNNNPIINIPKNNQNKKNTDFNNINNNDNNINNNSINLTNFFKNDYEQNIDRVKSFEDYYSHNNIENVVHELEIETFKKLNKKIKKGNFLKSKYQLFYQNNIDINQPIPIFLRGSNLFGSKKSILQRNNSGKNENYYKKNENKHNQPLVRRYFFKNSLNLKKLIEQEKFDPEKIKEYYRKKYLKDNKKKILYVAFQNFFLKGVLMFKKLRKLIRKKKNENILKK